MGIRRKARELALQFLYQSEITNSAVDISLVCENFKVNKRAIPYAEDLIGGISGHFAKIDEIIRKYAKNWRVDRMSIIDRNILRIGVFELLFQEDLPATVAINESIEIAKRFASEESPAFINGILDAVNDGER